MHNVKTNIWEKVWILKGAPGSGLMVESLEIFGQIFKKKKQECKVILNVNGPQK